MIFLNQDLSTFQGVQHKLEDPVFDVAKTYSIDPYVYENARRLMLVAISHHGQSPGMI